MVNGKISIGWAQGDITPLRKTLVCGQFHTRIADKVVSPLTANALAFEAVGSDGTKEQAVLLSCDLPFESFKSDMLQALTGRCPDLDHRKITVNCTHTHTAPALRRGWYNEPENDPDFMNPDEYRLWLVQQLADVIENAWNKRQPGSIARGFGYAVVGRCRRAVYADGSARMYGDTSRPDFQAFEACDNHAINMLFTRDGAGSLSGMIINVACPSQCEESGVYFSADFWHNVREAVKARYGSQVHVLAQCAPAGDMSPHLLSDNKEEKDLRDRIGTDDKGIICRRIMAAVDEGLATASVPQEQVVFAHDVKTLTLPRLMVTKEEYELEKSIRTMSAEERAKQPYAFQQIWPFGLVCNLIERYERQDKEPNHRIEAHFIRLGDVAFATNPFELFIDYSHQIHCRSNALQTFQIQLADGSENGFYLPTQRARDGGHYSALIKSNWVGPEGGKVLVDESGDAINSVFTDVTYAKTR